MMTIKLAYLTNRYPKVSHSFIRREVLALERRGVAVERFSVRPAGEDLVDPADIAERRRTHVLLGGGLTGWLALLADTLMTALRRPVAFLRAAALAWGMARRAAGTPGAYLRHAAYLAEAARLVRLMAEAGVTHLHAHFGTNPAAVARLARALGGPPYSFTVHGPEEFDAPAALSLAGKAADAAFVVAISEFGRGQILRHLPHRQWSKVKVVRCGVDSSFLAGGPQPVPSSKRLVCVGRLCEQKGQLLLLQAAGRLAARGVDFELILAGDGEMRADLEAEIARLGLGDRVRITGWLSGEQVRRELLAARAMVLPSLAEGLPVVIMEALALGRPVISTQVAGIPELIRDRACGWLVPAGSVARLAEAMSMALRTPTPQLAMMGAVGHELVADRHDIDAEAGRLAELFLSGGRVAPSERSSERVVEPLALPSAAVTGVTAIPAAAAATGRPSVEPTPRPGPVIAEPGIGETVAAAVAVPAVRTAATADAGVVSA
jgi:glycosyltransferase involved in cell wall biosynthesis